VLEVKPQPVSGSTRSDPQAGLSIAEAARRAGVAAGDADQLWAPNRAGSR
jgi:hypothetical protein